MYTDKSPDSGSETRSEGTGSTVGAESRGNEEAQWRNHSEQTVAVRAPIENSCWNQGIPKGFDRCCQTENGAWQGTFRTIIQRNLTFFTIVVNTVYAI